MEAIKARTFVRGMGLAAGYCAAFLITWEFSFNQWYLPAGLRLASLLLLPMRYWPYVFAGDAAALLCLRIPKADQYSIQWAYLSPFLFMPVYSLVPYLFGKRFTDSRDIVFKLPLIAISAAFVTSVWAMALNYMLDGPRQLVNLPNFIRYWIGDYFGIMIVMLPCMLWAQRAQWKNTRIDIAKNIAIAILVISALYAAAMLPGVQDLSVRLIPLALMLIAIAYLTLLHAWHGAAVGTLLVGAAIAFALPRIKVAGAADDAVLMAQVVLAVASSVLLVIGVRISRLHDRSGDWLRGELLAAKLQEHIKRETQTMGGIRAMFHSFEQRFREKALLIAYARDDLDGYRHAVAQVLKDEGLYQQAMDAMSTGVASSRALVRHSELLYPLDIETHGLVGVLTSETFEDRWKGRARIEKLLTGRTPKRLSIPLQLAAYRAICSAMDVLATMEPTKFHILARGWERRGRKGITIFVSCTPTTALAQDSSTDLALQELQLLARAYDGAFQHRHTHRIGVLMSEPLPPT